MDDEKSLDVEFDELVKGICVRPKMYVANGTYWEVAAYLDGYTHGRHRSAREGRWHEFSPWLAERLDGWRSGGWAGNLLHHCGGGEAAALRQLPAFYDEFVAAKREAAP